MNFSSAGPTADEVTVQTVWGSKAMPELGLSDDTGLGYRVYVLDCADSCLYVGIEVKARLASRLKQHFASGGAFFTKQHRPRALHLVWPAACTAVECYVYHALLAMQPAGRVERLGGWTQTSTKVSPLAALVFEQARRSLRGSCFNCGGPHYADKCQKEMQGCAYPCPSCSTSVVVSSRGQSQAASSVSSPPRGASPQATQALRAPAPSAKRASSAASSGHPVAKAARVATAKSGCVVSVCGKEYSSLSWYLAKAKPTERECARARANCGASALALRHGDVRTLAVQGFTAQPPRAAKPLMAGRVRMPSEWTDTDCKAVSSGLVIQLSRAGEELRGTRANQLLWRMSELQREFAPRV
jgi:hypothetical protein